MNARFSIVLILLGAGCPGNQVSTTLITSGRFVLDDDASVVLEVDAEARTFTLSEAGGESVSGTLSALDEEAWLWCCYLNGSGHSEFETVALSVGAVSVGPVELSDAHLAASGPLLFEGELVGGGAYDIDGYPLSKE